MPFTLYPHLARNNNYLSNRIPAAKYRELVAQTTAASRQRSGKVSTKDQDEEQVRKTLRALIHHIKAQFPDTFEARLREFGFQKESY